MILPPSALLGVADQIRAGYVVMMADFCPTHTAEELFRTVRVNAGPAAVSLPVVDPAHLVPAMQIVP